MLRCKSLLGALAVLLMVSLASAQEQPRGRGGRGFGGFGGPGGMMGGPTALLRMPEVRKELALTDEQNKEIDKVQEQLVPPGGFGNFQDLSDEERQKFAEEMRKKGEEANASIKKILKPEQAARLDQLSLQRQGIGALTRPEVAKQLGLTQEQQDKVQKIQEASGPQRGQGGPGGGFQNLSDEERQKLRTEAQERRQKAEAEMLAVLTDDQKTKWTEMKGKEFTFPQFGGPGGGGRGGAGGPGGERRRPPTKQ